LGAGDGVAFACSTVEVVLALEVAGAAFAVDLPGVGIAARGRVIVLPPAASRGVAADAALRCGRGVGVEVERFAGGVFSGTSE